MCDADQHTYQMVTKSSERMRDLLATKLRFAATRPSIWWGVSVENRRHGLPRTEHLRASMITIVAIASNSQYSMS